LQDRAAFELALDYLSAGLMDRAERLLEELAASRDYRKAALDHLGRIYEQQGDWANALKVFDQLPPAVQAERRTVAAHYLCELAEHALLQGDTERARTLLRQSRSHDAQLPRAEVLTARMTELANDPGGALALYFKALETSPGLALEIIPRILNLSGQVGDGDVLTQLIERLGRNGRVSSRQLVWLLATALPPAEIPRLSGVTANLGAGLDSPADALSLGTLLTRIGDAGGRYQCDDCGLHSVGWFWRCPKCRTWDSMRPSVFKWAARTDESAMH
jgi:lipopolysaccharide biosynthesis regulator YciM